MRNFLRMTLVLIALIVYASAVQARTLRLFLIGNSFSDNAKTYLPQLSKEGGHDLTIGAAQVAGCSLERHWKAAAASIANADDPDGKLYGGKTLHQMMGNTKWDVVTIQQNSANSPNVETYQPYARDLYNYVKKLQPQAEVVFHQTWAYRTDAKSFGNPATGSGRRAQSQHEMYAHSRAAYRQIAGDLGVRVIPNGDAFWNVDSDPIWGFKPDTSFDLSTAVEPALPNQKHSLHVGYRWQDGKLSGDFNHAAVSGKYLGGLVFYSFLFNESPEKLTFVPSGVDADFAAHLRTVAWKTVRAASEDNTPSAGTVVVPAMRTPTDVLSKPAS